MQNKQLQRQLKNIIYNLKGQQILNLIDSFQKESQSKLAKQFTKSFVNCICCNIKYGGFKATGFGRNQQESFINACKNLLQSLICANDKVEFIQRALKINDKSSHEKENKENQMQQSNKHPKDIQKTKRPPSTDNTLDLDTIEQDIKMINELSQIDLGQNDEENQQDGNAETSCKCVYYEIHKHHANQIRNLEARMKLVSKENQMLKQILLKDYKTVGKKLRETEIFEVNAD